MKLLSGFPTTVPHPSRQLFDLQQFAFWCQEKVNLPPSVKASHLRADVRCGRETFTCGKVFKRGAEILKGSRRGTDIGENVLAQYHCKTIGPRQQKTTETIKLQESVSTCTQKYKTHQNLRVSINQSIFNRKSISSSITHRQSCSLIQIFSS